MALTTYTLDLTTKIPAPDPTEGDVYLEGEWTVTYLTEGGLIVDTETGTVHAGPKTYWSDGTLTLTLPALPQTNVLPPADENPYMRVRFVSRSKKNPVYIESAPFQLTANKTLEDIVDTAGVAITSTILAQALAAQAGAEAAEAGALAAVEDAEDQVVLAEAQVALAEAVRDEVEDLRSGITGDLGTTDSQAATLINDDATPSLTRAALDAAVYTFVRDNFANSYDLREFGTLADGEDHTSVVQDALADLASTADIFGDYDELVIPHLGYSVNLGALTWNKGLRLTCKGHITIAGVQMFTAGDVEITDLRVLADPALPVSRPFYVIGAASGAACTSFKWKGGGGRNLPGVVRTNAVPVVEIDGLDVTMPASPLAGATAMLFDDVDTSVVVKNNRLVGPIVGSEVGSPSGIGFQGSYNITLDNNDIYNFYTSVVTRESPKTTNVDRYSRNMTATRNRCWNPRRGYISPGVMDQSQGFYIQSLQGGNFHFNLVDNPQTTAYAFYKLSASPPVGWSAWPACRDLKITHNRAVSGAATENPSHAFICDSGSSNLIADNDAEGAFTYGLQMRDGYRNRAMRNHFELSRPEAVRGIYTGNETESVIAHNSGDLVDSDGGTAVRAVQVVVGTAPGTVIGPNYFKVTGGVDFHTDSAAAAVDWIRVQPPGKVVTKTSTYTATLADATVLASGTWTLTLPLPATAGAGHRLTVKNTGTGSITVGGGGGTIDGASTYVISGQYESRDFVCDGTNWSVI